MKNTLGMIDLAVRVIDRIETYYGWARWMRVRETLGNVRNWVERKDY
jgi:hypothetical protein